MGAAGAGVGFAADLLVVEQRDGNTHRGDAGGGRKKCGGFGAQDPDR